MQKGSGSLSLFIKLRGVVGRGALNFKRPKFKRLYFLKMTWIAPHLTGGLGNRLFQYGAAAGLSEKWGLPVVFFLPRCGPTNHGPFDNIFKLFPKVSHVNTSNEWDTLLENAGTLYTYQEFPAKPTNEKCHIVQGWRQTEKYFPTKGLHLDFENALGLEKISSLNREITEPVNTWFIHVRLGDYKVLAHHQVNLTSYYTKCLEKVPRGSTLLLFSDEPKACANSFAETAASLGLDFVMCDTPDELVSLYLMSLCKGGAITANSTFSWWGAYCAHQGASPAFQAFYPASWGQGMPPATDIVPSWGTRIEVE